MSIESYAPAEFERTSLDEAQIADLNDEFSELLPVERIEKAAELFAGRLVLSSSFGPTAPLLLKLTDEAAAEIPVVTIRHGHETDRTLELADWYQEAFGFDLKVYKAPYFEIPPEGTEAFTEFQQQVKIGPFKDMLNQLRPQAYLSGAMRWQTDWRAELPFVQDKGSALAIYPLADIDPEAVDDFFNETGLPRNNDYFDPAKGSDQKSECGLNLARYALGAAA